MVKFEGFKRSYRHPLSVDRIKARNRIANDEKALWKLIKILISISTIGEKRIMADISINQWILVRELFYFGSWKTRREVYKALRIRWRMISVNTMQIHQPTTSFDGSC